MAGKSIRKRTQTAVPGQQYGNANVTWKTGIWIAVGIIIGCFVMFRGCGSSAKVPDYKYTIYDSTVNQDGITVKAITAVASAGLSADDYKSVARDVSEKYMTDANGGVWVFDDAAAEKLQWKSGLQWKNQPVDLTADEENYYDKHLRGQSVVKNGVIKNVVGM